jgi:hypothetical protein
VLRLTELEMFASLRPNLVLRQKKLVSSLDDKERAATLGTLMTCIWALPKVVRLAGRLPLMHQLDQGLLNLSPGSLFCSV